MSGYICGANACQTMIALVFDCLFLLFALIIKTSFINFSSCYPDADVCDFQAAAAGDADGVQKGMGNWTGKQKDASHNIRMMLPMTARWQ